MINSLHSIADKILNHMSSQEKTTSGCNVYNSQIN
jgi:hypothetical protein